ncbi:MAG: hypothetical protein OXD36_08830 [Rhodobacter sp.]|nr:hypothetical protein [Rhodobacter sp.]
MRISKFTLPALTVAGALALAGCGGGSDSNGNDDPPPPPPPPPGTEKTAEVPDSGSIVTGQAGLKTTLADGETRRVVGFADGTAYWFTCEDGTCEVEIGPGESVGAVSYTGTGTLTIRTSDHRLPENAGGGDSQPTEDTSPLSHATLFKALSGESTIWRAGSGENGISGTYKEGDKTVALSLESLGASTTLEEGDDHVYWGLWNEHSTESGSSKVTQGQYGAVMGGNSYGKKPESSVRQGTDFDEITSATYTSAAPIVHYREKATDIWTPLTLATGGQDGEGAEAALSATLTANFGKGTVGGNINIRDDLPNIEGDVGIIYFRDGPIDGDGKFGGSAESEHSKRQTGGWNGEFFGDTTTVEIDDDGPNISHPAVPAHAAATFSLTRPKVGDQDSLTIRGAFGAPDTDG